MKILLNVHMRPAAIALNYSVENIRNDVRQKIIGASLSEPHTSELNGGFSNVEHCGGSVSKLSTVALNCGIIVMYLRLYQ